MRDDADLTTDAGDSPARPPGTRIRHLDLELLSLHIDGGLDPGTRSDAQAHLAACSECQLNYTELRMTVSLLQGLPQYEPRISFVLGSEYGKVKRRPIPAEPMRPAASFERPAASPPWVAPAAPAPRAPWYSHLMPGTGALKVASGLVGVALLVSIAGDAMIADPPPTAQRMGITSSNVTTAILPPVSDATRKAAAPENVPVAPQQGVTDPSAPALQQGYGAPAVAASTGPSPWRIAQIGLGMLLLWLVVSLAGRIWVDRHDSQAG
jgi:anti-sigma factor RsiW